jgi:hypothetical protein
MAIVRAHHQERVAMTGLLLAMCPPDGSRAVEQLEAAIQSARDLARAQPRSDRARRDIYELTAEIGTELLPCVKQLAERLQDNPQTEGANHGGVV